jgi:hypothetical protein
MLNLKSRFALAALSLCAGAARADNFVVTIEAPSVQTPNVAALCAGAATCTVGTESFDTRPQGAFTTNYGTGGTITGSYSGSLIEESPDIFGAAGGVGQYIATFSATGYSIALTHTADIPGVNYFGFWLSALDSGNQLQVLRNGVVVGTYQPSDLIAAVGVSGPYFGNPNNGGNSGQPYAFVNFFDTDGFFDQINIFESPTIGGYESDNHTVAFRNINTTPGDPILPPVGVPEPEELLLLAVGAAGLFIGRKSASVVAAERSHAC